MNDTPLPPQLHPFATNHPASSAYRMHLSPHEWTWTQPEQEAMALAVIELDAERQRLDAVRLAALKAVGTHVSAIPESHIENGRLEHAFVLQAHRILSTGNVETGERGICR